MKNLKNLINKPAKLKSNINLVRYMALEGKTLIIKDFVKHEFSTTFKYYAIVECEGNSYEIDFDFLEVFTEKASRDFIYEFCSEFSALNERDFKASLTDYPDVLAHFRNLSTIEEFDHNESLGEMYLIDDVFEETMFVFDFENSVSMDDFKQDFTETEPDEDGSGTAVKIVTSGWVQEALENKSILFGLIKKEPELITLTPA